MDQSQHGQPTKGIGPLTQEADGKNQNQSNHMMAPTNPQTQTAGPSAPSPYVREQQYAPQFMYQTQQDHLQQQLNNFWANKCQEIEETTDFRSHNLPLARIKKIMKADEGVKMVSTEAPMVFAKASEMFIQELTMRSWANADVNSRRTLQKSDIASAISRSDRFGFLVDIVPRDDTVEREAFPGIPRKGSALTDNIPSYYRPPHQHVAGPSSSAPRMVMGRYVLHQNHNGQQTHPFPTPMMPTPKQEDNHSSNLDD